MSFKCTCEEEVGCPCGSNFNMFICTKTPDCKSRKNWQSSGSQKSSSTVTSSSESSDAKTSSEIAESKTITSGSGYTKSSHDTSNTVPIGKSLLPVQEVDTTLGKKLRTMFDNCSQTTFVSENTARKLRLKGVQIIYTLVCTDGREELKVGHLYNLVLVTKNGKNIHIQAIGIEKLSGKFSAVNVKGITTVFPKHNVNDADLERSSGDLDLLIGADLAELHPASVKVYNKLVLLRSMFGSGWTIFGFDKNVVSSDGDEYNKANHVAAKDIQFLELVSSESIGVDIPRRCGNCQNCKECKLSSQRVSYLESLEDQLIQNRIEYMPEKKRYIVSYPYTKEIFELLPNKELAMDRVIQLENTLMKSPKDLESANKVLFDSFKRGVFRYLDEEEFSYSGPIHYLAMNRAYKESVSTPCRLVFDSSQPDKNGRSLNSCMGKGKNPLNYFGGVILNWRAAEQVACGDISKMFNQCEVRDFDMHVRRFFIRPDGFGGNEP